MQEETSLVASLGDRCRARQGTILALPEDDDVRVVSAAFRMLEERLVERVILSDRKTAKASAEAAGVALTVHEERISYLSSDYPGIEDRTAHLVQSQAASRGKVAAEEQLARVRESRLAQCGELLHEGQCSAVVAGAVASTAEVIRMGISTVGLARGIRTVSGSFLFLKKDAEPFLFADCGVVVEPTVTQLVDIAAASLTTWRTVCPEREPVLAFLSFSTKGSAEHANAEKMSEAAKLFQSRYPDVCADGELQFDAAYDADIGRRKAPHSKVPGRANIYLFPDLDAGNIAYKITQRLAGFHACGPLLQGLAKPFSDLSRGSTVDDIVLTSCINLLK